MSLKLSALAVSTCAALVAISAPAHAADHLDTPSVIADPRLDIGDLFAWTTPDRRLNLVLDLVGKTLSPQASYVFHVDAGPVFGVTRRALDIVCRAPEPGRIACDAGRSLRLEGDMGAILASADSRMRLFAGLRDDPFFNNVRGSRAAYGVAQAAVAAGAPVDKAGCATLGPDAVTELRRTWRMTDGGPGRNFLKGWTTAAIVVSLDLQTLTERDGLIAVWGAVETRDGQVDRMGRPLTGNALLGQGATPAEQDALKERYNRAAPKDWPSFAPEIAKGLAFYDGFNGRCGDAFLAEPGDGPQAYRRTAALLADDRLWIDAKAHPPGKLFAVERATLAGRLDLDDDSGGRRLDEDAVDIWRSLLVDGSTGFIDDGVGADDGALSPDFPFLVPPERP